jgi:tetratricopeptide (TPR) repeat protein
MLMRNLWTNGLWLRILGGFVLVVLLGFSPRAHAVDRSLQLTTRTLEFDNLTMSAEHLAFVAEQQPWRTELWELAGNYAWDGENPIAAGTYYQAAAARGTLSEQGYLRWGLTYAAQGNSYSALQVWQAAQNIFGVSEEIVGQMVALHRKNADFPALIAALKTLVNFPSQFSDPQLNYELGLLLAIYDPATAPAYLLGAYEINPELAAARELSFTIQRASPVDNPPYTIVAVGQKLAALHKWDFALRAFEHAIQLQPDYAEAWAFLGEAQQHQVAPEPDAGLAALETAIQLDPQSLAANSFLAIFWQRRGDYDRAIKYLATAAKIDPANPDLQIDLGAAQAINGNLDLAEDYYQQALANSPHNPQYFRELIEFYLRYNLNIKKVALPLARAELLIQPDNPEVLDTMGQVMIRLGDLQTAERFLQRAVARDPGFARVHLHLGVLYSLKSEPRLAAEHLWLAQNFGAGTHIANQAARFLADIYP